MPLNEDDYTDGPKLFINNLDIPTFNIEGKKGTFFGLFETSAGASGGGGYSIILVNIDTNEHTIINQDASADFSIYKNHNDEIEAFINYRYDRAVGWHGGFPDEVSIWGNLSGEKKYENKK